MNRQEIQALIDAAPDGRWPSWAPPQPPILRHQAGRPRVTIPYQVEPWDDTIVINAGVHVDFCGGVALLPNGVSAVLYEKGAWRARVENLTPFGLTQNGAAHGAPAFLIRSYGAELHGCLPRFCGTGISVWSDATHLPDAVQVTQNQVFNCDSGIELKGGDVNGGSFVGNVIHSCRRGIGDAAFLGNFWMGTMLHTIAERAYHCTVTANYSTHVGTYVEADCGVDLPGGYKATIDDQPNITWVGGNAAAIAMRGTRLGLNRSRIRFGDTLPSGDELNVTIPHAAAESALTAERKLKTVGTFIDGWRMRLVSSLKQWGIESYTSPANANGLTRPFSWGAAGHVRPGQPLVGALPSTVGAPAGFVPARAAFADLPSPATFFPGDVVEVIDVAAKTRKSYLLELNEVGVKKWGELTGA